jgi:hypothetical protein
MGAKGMVMGDLTGLRVRPQLLRQQPQNHQLTATTKGLRIPLVIPLLKKTTTTVRRKMGMRRLLKRRAQTGRVPEKRHPTVKAA